MSLPALEALSRPGAVARPLRAMPVPDSELHAATPSPRSAGGQARLTQVHPAQTQLDLVPDAPTYRGVLRAPGRLPAGAPALVAQRAPGALDDDGAAPRRTAHADLPDPAPLVCSVVCAAIEVIAGSRPAAQLLRWLTADAYAQLQRQAAAAAGARCHAVRVRRATVRRVRTTSPRDGVVEASVVVLEARRVRAVALRVEGWDGRWRVTALQVG